MCSSDLGRRGRDALRITRRQYRAWIDAPSVSAKQAAVLAEQLTQQRIGERGQVANGPNAVFVPCDFDAYREASKSVFAILDHYSPVIEPIALDEAYLDLTGEEALLGPPGSVALRLRDEVKAGCGLDLSIGVASCKLVAKVGRASCRERV